MIVLGFDPGAWLGWCALAIDAAGPRYLAAGVLSVEELGEDRAREEALHHADAVRADAVAVEEAGGIAPGTVRALVAKSAGATIADMSRRLSEAAWRGGELCAASRAAGRLVLRVSAGQVRGHYIASDPRARKAVDQDAAVRAAIGYFVLWPERIGGTGRAYRKDGTDLLADARPHVYDAALAALYAGTVLAPQPAAATPPQAVDPRRGAVA